MSNALAIAGKELRSYFASPMGWVICGFFALIFGFFFNTYVDFFITSSLRQLAGGTGAPMNINISLIRPLFSNATVIVLFVLPSITMRTYAEEKRSGTIE